MVDVTDAEYKQQIIENKEEKQNLITVSTSKNWIKSVKQMNEFITDQNIHMNDVIALITLLKTNKNYYILPTKTKTVQYILNQIFILYTKAYDDDYEPKTNIEIINLFCSSTAAKTQKINKFRETIFYKTNYSKIIKSFDLNNFTPYQLDLIINQSQISDSDLPETWESTAPQTNPNQKETNNKIEINLTPEPNNQTTQSNNLNLAPQSNNSNNSNLAPTSNNLNLAPQPNNSNSNNSTAISNQIIETKTNEQTVASDTLNSDSDNDETTQQNLAVPLPKELIIDNFETILSKQLAINFINNKIKNKITNNHFQQILQIYEILQFRFRRYHKTSKIKTNKYLSHFVDWYHYYYNEYETITQLLHKKAIKEIENRKLKYNDKNINHYFNEFKSNYNEHIRLLNTNFAKSIIIHGYTFEILQALTKPSLFVTNMQNYCSLIQLIFTVNIGLGKNKTYNAYRFLYDNITQFIIESINQLQSDKYLNKHYDNQNIK